MRPGEHVHVESTTLLPDTQDPGNNESSQPLKLRIKRNALIAVAKAPLQCSEPGCNALLDPNQKRRKCDSCTRKRTSMSKRQTASESLGSILPAIAICSSCYAGIDTKDLPDGSLHIALCEACQLQSLSGKAPGKASQKKSSSRSSASKHTPLPPDTKPAIATATPNSLAPTDIARMAAAYVHPENLDMLMHDAPDIPRSDSSRNGGVTLMHAHYEQAFGAPPALAHINQRGDRAMAVGMSSARANHYLRNANGATVRISGRSLPPSVQLYSYGDDPLRSYRDIFPVPALVPIPRAADGVVPTTPESPERTCMSSGCGAVLPPDHIWTFCAKCLDIPEDSFSAVGIRRTPSTEQAPASGGSLAQGILPVLNSQPPDKDTGDPPRRPSLRIRIGPRPPVQAVSASSSSAASVPLMTREPLPPMEQRKASIVGQPAAMSPNARNSAPMNSSAGHALDVSMDAIGFVRTGQKSAATASVDGPKSAHTASEAGEQSTVPRDAPKDNSVIDTSIGRSPDASAAYPSAKISSNARRASAILHQHARSLAEMLPPPLVPEPVPTQFAPRACSTKGCMELVPPESRWSRCATCGLQKWRKLRDRMVNGYASASKTSAASKGKEQEGPPNRNPPDAKRPSLGDRNSSSRILDIPMAPNLTLVENATDISTSPGRKVGQDSIPSDKLDTSVPAVEVEDHNIKMVDGTDTSDQAAGLIVSRGQPTNILEASIASLPPLKESGPDTTSVSPPASPAISKASGRLLDSDQRLTSPTAVSAARSSPAVQSSTTKDEGESEIDPDESEEEPLAKVVAKKKPPRVRLIVRPPPTAPVATVCGTNRCQNLLYPTSRWKLCDPCRSYFRRYQRKRREGTEEGQPRHHNEQAGDSPVMPLFSEIRATEMRICTIRGCGNVLLPLEEYRWKMCERCRSRTRDDAHTQRWGDAAVALPVASGDVVMADVEDEAAVPRKRPRADSGATKQQIAGHAATAPDGERSKYKKRKTKDKASDRQRVAKLQFSEASAYQHLPTLLETLQERFSSFMVAQAHYLRFKLMHRPEKDKMYPVLFAFDGEYSVVADPSGGPVDTLVRRIVLQVQSTVGMDFRPAGVITGPDWAVISKFSCVHELQIPVPLPAPDPDPESPDTPTKESIGIMLKQMVGELEIIVAWDRRHRRIPGQRFVIRLRLLG